MEWQHFNFLLPQYYFGPNWLHRSDLSGKTQRLEELLGTRQCHDRFASREEIRKTEDVSHVHHFSPVCLLRMDNRTGTDGYDGINGGWQSSYIFHLRLLTVLQHRI